MHEAVFVEVVHSIQQLPKDPPSLVVVGVDPNELEAKCDRNPLGGWYLVLGKLAALKDVIEQVTALSVLHDQTQPLAVLHHIKEFDDVFVWWQLGKNRMLSPGLLEHRTIGQSLVLY